MCYMNCEMFLLLYIYQILVQKIIFTQKRFTFSDNAQCGTVSVASGLLPYSHSLTTPSLQSEYGQ